MALELRKVLFPVYFDDVPDVLGHQLPDDIAELATYQRKRIHWGSDTLDQDLEQLADDVREAAGASDQLWEARTAYRRSSSVRSASWRNPGDDLAEGGARTGTGRKATAVLATRIAVHADNIVPGGDLAVTGAHDTLVPGNVCTDSPLRADAAERPDPHQPVGQLRQRPSVQEGTTAAVIIPDARFGPGKPAGHSVHAADREHPHREHPTDQRGTCPALEDDVFPLWNAAPGCGWLFSHREPSGSAS